MGLQTKKIKITERYEKFFRNLFTYVEDFFVDGTFRTKGVYGLRSMNDGEHYTVLENNGTRIVKYSYKTGLPVATLLDLKTLEDSTVSRIDDYTFNADESRILICTNKKPIYRR